MKNRNDTTFLMNLFNEKYPLNITTTHVPVIDGANNLITLNLDGTFYDVEDKTNHVKKNTFFPTRVSGDKSNSQQIFIHQSMLASLFFALDGMYLPAEVNNQNVTNQLTGFFSEIQDYYGEKSNTTLKFNLLADNGDFLSINKSTGLEIGRKGNAVLQMLVFCANDTTPQELAVEFSMNLVADLNVSSDNYYIYINLPYFVVSNVTITNDKVGMYHRDYNKLISAILMTLVTDLNAQFATPYDMRTIWPDFMMLIVNVFTYPRISPYYYDEFIYLGLTYFMDPWTFTTTHEKFALEERIRKDHGSLLSEGFFYTYGKCSAMTEVTI
jgi:hypothetical protein